MTRFIHGASRFREGSIRPWALFMAVGMCVIALLPGPAAGQEDEEAPALTAPVAGSDIFATRPVDRLFQQLYAQIPSMSADAFLAQSRRDYDAFDLPVEPFAFREEMVDKLDLVPEAEEALSENGFVVIPGTPVRNDYGKGFSTLYYDIYENDLPVFISADSMLHAWHRAFDDLMEQTEENEMLPLLEELLTDTLKVLLQDPTANRDAILYLYVPLCLIDEESVLSEDFEEAVMELTRRIYDEERKQVDFLGDTRQVDFSIFRPRGHYGNTWKLMQYFRAMTWLIHFPLVLHTSDQGNEFPRQEAAARRIAGAAVLAGGRSKLLRIDRYYSRLVGESTDPSPLDLLRLCKRAGLPGCQGSARRMDAQYARLLSEDQRLLEEVMPPEVTLRFFPAKLDYTAWVTARTTAPRMKPFPATGGRTMASVHDVAYALGSDRAAAHLESDLALPHRQHLPRTLLAARRTLHRLKPSKVADTPCSHWLEALMAASEPGTNRGLPLVMRTEAWHDKKLESVLASWTEMRHDTILIVKTWGGSGCDFPRAYVEPLVDTYRSLEQAAVLLREVYKTLDVYQDKELKPFFTHFIDTMRRLQRLATKHLEGEPLDETDMAYVNRMLSMERDMYTGERYYDGWYPRLYLDDRGGALDDPLVADIFGDEDRKLVLQVATGHPGIAVVAIETGGERTLYAGPVSSFYTFEMPASERLTDDAWRNLLAEKMEPEKPQFTRGYWVE